MKIDPHTILFWLGIAGMIASAVAEQFGGHGQVGLIASVIVSTLAKVERGIQAYEDTPNPPATSVTVQSPAIAASSQVKL